MKRKELLMPKGLVEVLYIVLMIAAIIIIDLLFFRHNFWERLVVNIGIVMVFAAFYFRFFKHL